MEIRQIAEEVFREESGRIVATLIRLARSFDRAEEAMQEAFAAALTAWPDKGVPQNPAAWIMAVAQRRLLDELRREKTRRSKQDQLLAETETACEPDAVESWTETMHFPDDRLRLIFTCCHPALGRESQVALTLRTLGGLTTPEIAKAFLLPEATLAQRLVRAKRKIEESAIPYEVPGPERLPERLASVQAVVYLIFNAGYSAMEGDHLVRRDLCKEAIRLARLLCQLMPREPENLGLLALMLLHDSRRDARVKEGKLVRLEEQDHALWDHAQIAEGVAVLDRAMGLTAVGPYQLQAAIAALHTQAETPQKTDWAQIAALYERLLSFQDSPVIALNRAVAVAMGSGFEQGLRMIDELGRYVEMERYYLFHAARADLLYRLERWAEAAEAYRRALALVTNSVEREFLSERLSQVSRTSPA